MSKKAGLFAFIFSRLFVVQLVIAVFLSAAVLYGTLMYLDAYTLHGEEITVPDLEGMDKKELKAFLKEKNLTLKIIDSTFVVDKDKGIVIGQNPVALSKVKKDRTIYITVNAMNPPSVRLPLLNDRSLRQAKSMIENVGLKLGQLIYRPDQCVNCVLAQKVNNIELKKDSLLPKGSVVDLVLGQGLSDEKVLVPLLLNLTRQEAIERLRTSFLNIGAEVYDEWVIDAADSSEAKIFSQSPVYGAKSWLQMGSSVDVEFTTNENKIDTNVVILDSSLYQTINAASDSI